ncbi:spore germination protein GerPE [Bacillaceae bacterium SIJ1]|nr:spore germination protein GerPE [Litoribacterium kuwaitense]
MNTRTSLVQNIQIVTVSSSSVTQIGDSYRIQANSQTIAVQREEEIFFGNEGDFTDSFFTKPFPYPQPETNVQLRRIQASPYLSVQRIRFIGVAASSVVHIGSTHHVRMESRVKHIRDLLPRVN